jgi:hypothetical protein
MTAIEMPRVEHDRIGGLGPSDREVIAVLQRMASARAHLTHAEHQAEAERRPAPTRSGGAARNRTIEDAHAEVIWAQAAVITTRRPGKAGKELEVAQAREVALLERHGFRSFRDYLDKRNAVPTNDVHLELARREYESAQESWEMLQAALAPTVILDLTGESPRVID